MSVTAFNVCTLEDDTHQDPAMTLTTAAPAGSLVVVSRVVNLAGTDYTACSDDRTSPTNTYSLGGAANATGTVVSVKSFYSILAKAIPIGGVITPDTGTNPGRGLYIADCFTGLLSSPLDSTVLSANGSSTSASPGASGTLAQADEILYMLVGSATTGSIGTPSGYTPLTSAVTTVGSNERKIATFYKETSATTTSTPASTLSVTGTWGALLFKLKVDTTPPPSTDLQAGIWYPL